MNGNIGDTLFSSLNRSFASAIGYIPNLLAGIVILLIGVILGSIVKRIVLEIFSALNIESYLKKYGIPEAKREFQWSNLLAEIARWFIIILFLIPTADVLGLPQITTLLNTFLLYLPNVFVAAILLLVGFALSRIAHDVVLASTRDFAADGSQAIASIVRWAILVFIMLAALNQLGVAIDLIRILFTGFVAMLALAGGIAFGLGGQETARIILDGLRKRIK